MAGIHLAPFVYRDPFALSEKSDGPVRRRVHGRLGVYKVLFAIVVVGNLVAIAGVLAIAYHTATVPTISSLAAAAAANVTLSIMIRQEYVINALFKLCWLVPHSAPLYLRRSLAKVYELGGVHSGTGVGAICWIIVFTVFVTQEYINESMDRIIVVALTYFILALFVAIGVSAHPKLRSKRHNTFEIIHRFAGWLCLISFWILIGLCAQLESTKTNRAIGIVIISMPSFWLICLSTVHTILPWLTLRRVQVTYSRLSDHAIIFSFRNKKIPPFSGIRISSSPLTEWHSFACLRDEDGNGGSLVISRAGDWTSQQIDHPRSYYWTKSIPVTGVLHMAQIFRSVVLVFTGSGIGPGLSFLVGMNENFKCHIIWAASSPETVFGPKICDMIKSIDPDARIIDTKCEGRPDLPEMAYTLYKEKGAEAVFTISNPTLTKSVLGLESRGVPSFGPIWDS